MAKGKANQKSRKKLTIVLSVVIPVVALFIIAPLILYAVFGDDSSLEIEKFFVNTRTVQSDNVADTINIVHLSDTHFPDIRIDLDKLIEKIIIENPDFIAITGDIVPTRGNVETGGLKEFLNKIVPIAPVFYVDGNHDRANRNMTQLHNIIRQSGAIILCKDYSSYNLTVRNQEILIVGLEYRQNRVNIFENPNNASAVVFLKHVPSFRVPIYYINASGVQSQVIPDLILAGHVHGGHIRIFNRAILCPDSLFFPRFSNGLYTNEYNTSMIVSRGLGNSLFFRRVNNIPHMPIVRLQV